MQGWKASSPVPHRLLDYTPSEPRGSVQGGEDKRQRRRQQHKNISPRLEKRISIVPRNMSDIVASQDFSCDTSDFRQRQPLSEASIHPWKKALSVSYHGLSSSTAWVRERHRGDSPPPNGINTDLFRINSGRVVHLSGMNSLG